MGLCPLSHRAPLSAGENCSEATKTSVGKSCRAWSGGPSLRRRCVGKRESLLSLFFLSLDWQVRVRRGVGGELQDGRRGRGAQENRQMRPRAEWNWRQRNKQQKKYQRTENWGLLPRLSGWPPRERKNEGRWTALKEAEEEEGGRRRERESDGPGFRWSGGGELMRENESEQVGSMVDQSRQARCAALGPVPLYPRAHACPGRYLLAGLLGGALVRSPAASPASQGARNIHYGKRPGESRWGPATGDHRRQGEQSRIAQVAPAPTERFCEPVPTARQPAHLGRLWVVAAVVVVGGGGWCCWSCCSHAPRPSFATAPSSPRKNTHHTASPAPQRA